MPWVKAESRLKKEGELGSALLRCCREDQKIGLEEEFFNNREKEWVSRREIRQAEHQKTSILPVKEDEWRDRRLSGKEGGGKIGFEGI